jgi:hypothetical protein
MKRLNSGIALVLIALALLFAAQCTSLRNPKKVPFEEAVVQLNTAKKVNTWLVRYFKYDFERAIKLMEAYPPEPFKEEVELAFWKGGLYYPSETYYKKKGVCFDAANFAAYCLHKAGYEVEVLSVKYKKRTAFGPTSHTVCAYKDGEKWWVIADTSQGKELGIDPFIDGPYQDLEGISKRLASKYGLNYYFLSRKKFEGQAQEPDIKKYYPNK